MNSIMFRDRVPISYLIAYNLIVACQLVHQCESARILAIFPMPFHSHQVVNNRYVSELANHGHEIVSFTSHPMNDSKLKNLKEIHLHRAHDLWPNMFEYRHSVWAMISALFECVEHITDDMFSHPEMQRIIGPNSSEHFDLIVYEVTYAHSGSALMKRLNAPLIGIHSMPLLPINHYAIGNSLAVAYGPGALETHMQNDNFIGRLRTFYSNTRWLLQEYFDNIPRQNRVIKKYFGSDMPCVSDIVKDVSLIFVNSHIALTHPRPQLPCVIEIGGIAVESKRKGLEPELQKFLDEAVDGFVYFSLGSNVKSKSLSAEKLEVLKSAFAELPYQVLWKWELDILSGKPANVFTSKWLPQQDVLAHPNIKVFIYQGGLQSTEEAISHGIPLVGMPVISDQEFNVQKLVSLGIAKRLDMATLTKNDITSAIIEIANDTSLQERVLKYRSLLRDYPQGPVERAMWWTDYIIRHEGAPHLRTNVRNMPWYERELLDIIAFLVAIALVIVYIGYKLLRFVVTLCRRPAFKSADKKVKDN